MFRKGNTKKVILLGLLVVLMLVLMNYTESGRVRVSPMETVLRDILAPVQGLTMSLGHRLRGLVSFPFTLYNAAEENQLMKKKLAELENTARQNNEISSENERLKRLLDFKTTVAPAVGFEVTGAAIIGKDPGNWFGIITINKGASQGLRPNMTVINGQGLVGRITSVSSTTSEVLLITDPRSGVSALIQETRAPGMVEGVASFPGQVRMVHIPVEAEPSKGQVVVTSGFGSMYPKGIPIGWVQDSRREPSGLFNSAIVVPFVDFNRIEEVLVITGSAALQEEPNIALLPYPWGEGRADNRGRSPGIVNAGEEAGLVVQ
ncbi:MAG TPA: rod shape-determining protein MreC [Desulfotomaculum sp.]|nr:rod shape-determining protein MreC [Desulfotomaculum sp.]